MWEIMGEFDSLLLGSEFALFSEILNLQKEK